MRDRYEPQAFESKWRQKWASADLFKTREEEGRPKFYGLDFFPYPSGAGLSVGHCRNYIPTDVLCRMKFMQGYNVLHPMGFDAFGLPAENEAIKTKTHPAPMIDRYAATYKRQMDLVGISYDWSREVKSCDPGYYQWTQWIFEHLYSKGLAYRQDSEVNWCPKDKTALANEEVVAGNCERCGTPVEKRKIPQWYFKITDYAQRLIDDLDELDWPEGIKNQQRNWIGRSEGVQFGMRVTFEPEEATIASDATSSLSNELRELALEVSQESGQISTFTDPRAEAISGRLSHLANEIENPLNLQRATESFETFKSKVRGETEFEVSSRSDELRIEVFTTRVDTIFGVTFCVLAPEHPLVKTIISQHSVSGGHEALIKSIESYVLASKTLGELNRQVEDREKTGVFSGAYAVNPMNGSRIPIWIADYVLMGYGTGAIMAVPAGDQRDFEFACKFGIPVVAIQEPDSEWLHAHSNGFKDDLASSYLDDPKGFDSAFISKTKPLILAGEYTGLAFEQATAAIGEWMEACGVGQRVVKYRLRDWLISRQRYWGCPIPICYDKDGNAMLIPENQLPVELPDVDSYEPSDDGSSPLSRITEFVNCTTPEGTLGRRETDTMGGFACSSWYFLRFCDPHNPDKAWDIERAKYWMPVDTYVGGAEHAVMHLLYARFWTKVLYDAGLVSVKEPFHKLKNQGQVLGKTPYRKPRPGETLDIGEDGILVSFAEAANMPPEDLTWKWVRMSKSKGNVVTPDEAVENYGADALRVFELFVAPFDSDVEWNNDGMVGTSRFLSRIMKFVSDNSQMFLPNWRQSITTESGAIQDIRRATHKTIRKATDDIERFAFNTYVSTLMEYLNTLNDLRKSLGTEPTMQEKLVLSEAIESLILLLAPSAPHTADELWEGLGGTGFTYTLNWPIYDPELAKESVWTIAVQVNGKLRDTIELPAGSTNEDLEKFAKESEKIQTHISGLTIRKVIVVSGKLVNIVAN